MHSNDTPLIHARGLTKRFGNFTAVDRIDFEVRPGEAFGFLGPNGAGKTSTMRMIACATPVSEGGLQVLHMSPRSQASRIKARLGVVPQQDNLDMEITVRENLLMYARYFDIPRATAQKPAAVLTAASFASMALCLTTIAKKTQDFDTAMALIMPMFLFSGIFIPVAGLPVVVQWIMRATPLYHAVALLRQLTTATSRSRSSGTSRISSSPGRRHSPWRCTASNGP